MTGPEGPDDHERYAAYWLGAGGVRRAGTLDEFMALIPDGQQVIVGDVRAAIPRGIDPAAGELGGLDTPPSPVQGIGRKDCAELARGRSRAGEYP